MLLIICGYSACGKDTLANKLCDLFNYKKLVSHTTRPKRDYEIQDIDYHFVYKKEFLRMSARKEFLEYRVYHTLVDNKPDTWYYGVHKDELKLNVQSNKVVVLDYQGLQQIKKALHEIDYPYMSIFLKASEEERQKRCIKRGDYNETEFKRRAEDDRKAFPLDKIKKDIDYIIDSTIVIDNAIEVNNRVLLKTKLQENNYGKRKS